MNPEILAYKGQLSTARARRLHLDAEATGVMTQLRMLLRVVDRVLQRERVRRLSGAVEDHVFVLHHVGDQRLVAHVAAHEADLVPHRAEVGRRGLEHRVERVEHRDFISGLRQAAPHQVGPQKTGTTNHQDVHACPSAARK